MNSKEFEILNEKMNMIFEDLIHLREDFDHYKQEMKERSLECKFEDAQHELNWARENRDRIIDYYKDVKNNYYNIERNVNDRYEYRMKDAQHGMPPRSGRFPWGSGQSNEREINMHASEPTEGVNL